MAAYCPDTGDIIWLDFLQVSTTSRLDDGLRWCFRRAPSMNWRVACPITRRGRDWSFHVAITGNDDVHGVVQADQVAQRVLGEARIALYLQSTTVLDEVRAKLKPLLSL